MCGTERLCARVLSLGGMGPGEIGAETARAAVLRRLLDGAARTFPRGVR